MSLLFNMLSRFVIAFLPMSKPLLISCLQSPSTVILEPKKIKSVTIYIVSPCICHEVMGLDAMIFILWMLSFKPAFSLSSFTLIKRLFSSSLSAIRVVSSAHLRLLTVLPPSWFQLMLHPVQHFHMMYSAYKLNKQGDNIQPWRTPFPILNRSVTPCLVLTVAWQIDGEKMQTVTEEAPKHFPKTNLHQIKKKKRSWSLVICCLFDPLQLSESWQTTISEKYAQ